MNDKPYQVRYTGKLKPGLSPATVIANLVLETGVSEEKAKVLIAGGEALVKRFATAVEAQHAADKLARAGALCVVLAAAAGEKPQGGKSLFSSFLQVFAAERG